MKNSASNPKPNDRMKSYLGKIAAGPKMSKDLTEAEAEDALSIVLSGEVSKERAAVFRLAWDFVGTGLGSRNAQYERFYLASGARNLQRAHTIADKARSDRLVEGFLSRPK